MNRRPTDLHKRLARMIRFTRLVQRIVRQVKTTQQIVKQEREADGQQPPKSPRA